MLFSDIIAGDLPDDAYLTRDLMAYFPGRTSKKYEGEIASHRLRLEIITRVLVNDLVNRGGPSFVSRLPSTTLSSASISA